MFGSKTFRKIESFQITSFRTFMQNYAYKIFTNKFFETKLKNLRNFLTKASIKNPQKIPTINKNQPIEFKVKLHSKVRLKKSKR
jgi:hypothetical protein